MEQRRPTTFTSILARVWHRSPVAPEGLAASGETLGEIAGLAPDEALHRLARHGEWPNTPARSRRGCARSARTRWLTRCATRSSARSSADRSTR